MLWLLRWWWWWLHTTPMGKVVMRFLCGQSPYCEGHSIHGLIHPKSSWSESSIGYKYHNKKNTTTTTTMATRKKWCMTCWSCKIGHFSTVTSTNRSSFRLLGPAKGGGEAARRDDDDEAARRRRRDTRKTQDNPRHVPKLMTTTTTTVRGT